MNLSVKLVLLVCILASCKNDLKQRESYDLALQNCQNIKEANPDNYFFLMNDCMANSELPAFQTKSISGKKINSELLKGKVTIINFWHTACAPCIAEIPGFNAIVNKYGDDVNYLSIASNTMQEVNAFLKKHPWSFTHISNENAIIEKVFKLPFGYPTTFILNQDAKIINSFSGGMVGEEAIEEIQNKIIPVIDKVLE